MTRPSLRFALWLAALAALSPACGGRSGLRGGSAQRDAGPPAPKCAAHSECPGFRDLCHPAACDLADGFCVTLAPLPCDDQDPCTQDSCDSAAGGCVFTPLTFDRDGDGHHGPRPGLAIGEPGACGDDCDDTSPLARPGAIEQCDGVDNDCNGVVDDGAQFVPTGQPAVRVSGDVAPAAPAGLAWSGAGATGYLATFTGSVDGKKRVFMQPLAADGLPLGAAEQLTLVNADAEGGSVVWAGDRYGIVWNDRRSGNYEVYLSIANAAGTKLIADVRLTQAGSFSLYPRIALDGTHFAVVWQDERDYPFAVYGQLVTFNGEPAGPNVRLSAPDGLPAEAPHLAAGAHGFGVAWVAGGTAQREVRFRHVGPELLDEGEPTVLTGDGLSGVDPVVVWNDGAFVVAWFDRDGPPFTVYAAVVSESGQLLVPATALATGPQHARYPWLMPLGDRLLVVFADDRDGNQGYELYGRMVTSTLEPAGAEQRMTQEQGHSVLPIGAFGPAGNVGILFRDDRLGEPHTYFTKLACVAAP